MNDLLSKFEMHRGTRGCHFILLSGEYCFRPWNEVVKRISEVGDDGIPEIKELNETILECIANYDPDHQHVVLAETTMGASLRLYSSAYFLP